MKLWLIIARKPYPNNDQPGRVVDIQLSEDRAYGALHLIRQATYPSEDLEYSIEEREP